ncbi:hypothetical protein D9M71_360410 [compost metagenome]
MRHLALVFEAFFVVLERRTARKDGLALLHRRHSAGAETAAIAYPVHLIHHRQAGIARAQEITMQRVHVAVLFHGLAGRRERLPQYLPAVQLAKTQVLATPTEQVFLNGFQAQQIDQIVQHMAHSRFS